MSVCSKRHRMWTQPTDPRPFPNTYWIQPRLLAGEYPGSAWDAVAGERLVKFLESGVSCFVDLTQSGEQNPYSSLLPVTNPVTGKQVSHHRFAIPDVSIPEEPAQMSAILDCIEQALEAGHGVYVHCRFGVGRTGLVAGCFLVRQGMAGDKALLLLHELWQQNARSGLDQYRYSPETGQQRAWVRFWRDS